MTLNMTLNVIKSQDLGMSLKLPGYVGNHKALLAVMGNNTTERFKPGHQWCWSGVDP